jgi:hypothetical protein
MTWHDTERPMKITVVIELLQQAQTAVSKADNCVTLRQPATILPCLDKDAGENVLGFLQETDLKLASAGNASIKLIFRASVGDPLCVF